MDAELWGYRAIQPGKEPEETIPDQDTHGVQERISDVYYAIRISQKNIQNKLRQFDPKTHRNRQPKEIFSAEPTNEIYPKAKRHR